MQKSDRPLLHMHILTHKAFSVPIRFFYCRGPLRTKTLQCTLHTKVLLFVALLLPQLQPFTQTGGFTLHRKNPYRFARASN